jgi:hypothetical protein
MVTLWNPADEAQELMFTLFFSSGHYRFPIHLGPRATYAFNVSEIIHNQIPDDEGNLIPATVHEGSAEISGALGENEHILVAMDSGVYNIRKATCNFFCETCNGFVSTETTIDPAPWTTAVSGTSQLTFTMTYNTGTQYNLTNQSTWSSSNTGVSTVSTGLVRGVSAGSATVTAQDNVTEPVSVGTLCQRNALPPCPTQTPGGSGPGTVTNNTPILTGIDPSDWPSGATTPGVTFTGQYFGTNAPTLTFSPSSGISYSLVSYNDTQIVANITVASGTPTEEVDVSVTNNGYGGVGFQSGGGSVSPTSAPVYATVRAPTSSPEVTVIAWVNGNAPDLNPLPTGENSTLQGNLSSSPSSCGFEVFEWSVLGIAANIVTAADSAYANAWLVKNSANTAPPSTITPSAQLSGGNYRLINDWGNGKGFYNVGITPDPCGTSVPQSILNWIGNGQPSQYMGSSGTSPSGEVYQLSEGRIGTLGQRGSQTINGGRTVPWIWSVIEFNSAGAPTYSNVGMFPTYSVYVSGTLVATYPQSTVAAFILNNSTYQRTPSQIP